MDRRSAYGDDHLGLHGAIRPRLGGLGGEIPHVHVVVLRELLQLRHDFLLDELLAFGAAGKVGGAFLLHAGNGGRIGLGQALEDVDKHGVGLGDVEADVGDGVGDESAEDGKDGAREHGEGQGGGEDLWACQRVVRIFCLS